MRPTPSVFWIRIRIGSVFRSFQDPNTDPYSQYLQIQVPYLMLLLDTGALPDTAVLDTEALPDFGVLDKGALPDLLYWLQLPHLMLVDCIPDSAVLDT